MESKEPENIDPKKWMVAQTNIWEILRLKKTDYLGMFIAWISNFVWILKLYLCFIKKCYVIYKILYNNSEFVF